MFTEKAGLSVNNRVVPCPVIYKANSARISSGPLAAARQRAAQGAFRKYAGGGIGMVQRLQQGDHIGPVGAAFDAQRTLSDRGQTVFAADQRADALAQPQAVQPGGGEDDGGILALMQFAQT